jgi:hypothetical protein
VEFLENVAHLLRRIGRRGCGRHPPQSRNFDCASFLRPASISTEVNAIRVYVALLALWGFATADLPGQSPAATSFEAISIRPSQPAAQGHFRLQNGRLTGDGPLWQLGLKLKAATAPRNTLVIDCVERHSEN